VSTLADKTLKSAKDTNAEREVVRWLQLLERGQNEDGSLAHTGLGLAEDVHAQNGLRNALVLNCKTGMDS